MLKRIIFTLLYEDGCFVLSRNFRSQRIGDVKWLQQNYQFSSVAESVDELMILDITRGPRNLEEFCGNVREVTKSCFIPVAVGGGVQTVETVERLMDSGADKIVVNTLLTRAPSEVELIASVIGAQSVVGSIDIKRGEDRAPKTYLDHGVTETGLTLRQHAELISALPIGELFLTSIDMDGTGMGLDIELANDIATLVSQPVILAGGVGHSEHIAIGLNSTAVSAVSTANLLNFVGDGLHRARIELRAKGIPLARFDS